MFGTGTWWPGNDRRKKNNLALSQKEPEREIYLAVPEDIFDSFFETPFGLLAITEYKLKLLIYDESSLGK